MALQEKQLGSAVHPAAYTLALWSMTISVLSLDHGAYMAGIGLSYPQMLLAVIIGNGIVALMMALNGSAGAGLGFSFNDALRHSFGSHLGFLCGLMRSLEAFAYIQIESYAAIDFAGRLRLPFSLPSLMWIFTVYVTALALLGSMNARTRFLFSAAAGIILMGSLLYFLSNLATPDEISILLAAPGYVPYASYEFFFATGQQAAFWSAVALNISDFTRYLPKRSSPARLFTYHFAGLVPPMALAGSIGYIGFYTIGQNEAAVVFAGMGSSRIGFFIVLAFLFLGAVTTNLLADFPAMIDVLQYWKVRRAPLAIGAASLLALLLGLYALPFDYEMVENKVAEFASYLGPFLGIMIVTSSLKNGKASTTSSRTRKFDTNAILALICGSLTSFLTSTILGNYHDFAFYTGCLSAAGFYLFARSTLARASTPAPSVMGKGLRC